MHDVNRLLLDSDTYIQPKTNLKVHFLSKKGMNCFNKQVGNGDDRLAFFIPSNQLDCSVFSVKILFKVNSTVTKFELKDREPIKEKRNLQTNINYCLSICSCPHIVLMQNMRLSS